jgi:histidyl-tRNA synthetase
MTHFLASSSIGTQGIEELQFVLDKVNLLGLKRAKLEFDVTLARGLNYYTGAIFEVKANGVKMGSICGGGRYDDLTGLFGMSGLSGVGISFGADRIYDVLTELDLFPKEVDEGLEVLFVNFGEKEADAALQLIKQLRENGVSSEIYPESAKLKKQFKYADDKGVNFTAIIGESELANGSVVLKNMTTGEQQELSHASFINYFTHG